MPRPKNHYRTGRYRHLLKGSAPKYMKTKPDIDNLAKLILDSFSGFFIDDAQVVELNCLKRYIEQDEQPKTIVMLDKYEE